MRLHNNLLLPVTAAFLAGCGGEPASEVAKMEDQLHQTGQLSLALQAGPTELDITQSLQLTLETRAPESFQIEFPAIEESALGDFTVETERSLPGELGSDNRLRKQWVTTLAPFLPGEYKIPSLDVTFSVPGEPNPETLSTDPIDVTVRSVLRTDAPPEDIHDIVGPLAMAQSWLDSAGVRIVLAFVVVAAVAAVAAILFRRRNLQLPPVTLQPAHEKALLALDELLAEHLLRKGQAKVFYQRVSAILRLYIEDRFGLHAPEQTTEEFLSSLSFVHVFQAPQKEALDAFLNHCDLVKFAEYETTTDDALRTAESCRTFIYETRPAEQLPETTQPPPVPAVP
jgi:hypothetical protein